MKYLMLLSLFVISWMLSASYSKGYLTESKPTLLANSIFNIFPPSHQNKTRIEQRSLPSEIRRELYNSISTGMSYEEVRAIIGWDGIAIYENEIDTPEGKIKERVYQWDNADIYDSNYSNYTDRTTNDLGLYWSVTLQFQNDILIEKSALNLLP